jgi:hypothetical protein
MQSIDIMSMKPAHHDKGYDTAGAVLYGEGGFLKKPPETMNRKQKLAFIESKFAEHGVAAFKEPFVIEIRCGAGLSVKVFNLAMSEGLRLHNIRNPK